MRNKFTILYALHNNVSREQTQRYTKQKKEALLDRLKQFIDKWALRLVLYEALKGLRSHAILKLKVTNITTQFKNFKNLLTHGPLDLIFMRF